MLLLAFLQFFGALGQLIAGFRQQFSEVAVNTVHMLVSLPSVHKKWRTVILWRLELHRKLVL